MDGCMTASRPACSHLQKSRVVGVSDIKMAGRDVGALVLRVAAQAKIGVVINEHFLVDGAVRVVADGATFVHGFVFEDERPRLVLMALRATLVLPGHCQASSRFKDIAAMRIVAVHAVHVTFNDRMMLGQIEFALHIEMTLKAGVGLFAGIDDELCFAAGPDVLAAGSMTGFTAAGAGHGWIFDV
jgi:hypothetical protein